MTLQELKAILDAHPDAGVLFALPSGESVPQHYHITEVGHVVKRFFDCGGTERRHESCTLQLWVANDLDHRLLADKISSILAVTEKIFPQDDLPVEVEYQLNSTTLFTVDSVTRVLGKLVFQLGTKRTDCLAPDRCGIDCC